MKHLLIFALATGLMACGNQKADSEAAAAQLAADQLAERNKAIVDRYFEASMTGDSKTMASLLTEDYQGFGLGVDDVSSKAETLESVDAHWSKYKYEGERFFPIEKIAMTTTKDGGRGRPAGDWVFVWGDMETDYPASPDYGDKAITAKYTFHATYRVNKDGKIDISNTYFNHEDIMMQLGYRYLSVADQKKVENMKLNFK